MSEGAVDQTPPADNSAIRQLRDQIDTLKNELGQSRSENQAISERLTAAEREKMSEIERLTAERDDFKKGLGEMSQFKSQAEKAAAFAESQYNKKIETISPDHKETVLGLTGLISDPFDRLTALENAVSLITPKATKAGTTTDPGATTPTVQAPTMGGKTPEENNKFNPSISLSDALAAKRTG